LNKCIFTLQRQFFLQNAGHLQQCIYYQSFTFNKRSACRPNSSFVSLFSDIRVIADGYPGIAHAEPGSGTGFLGAPPEIKSNTHNYLLNLNKFMIYSRPPERAVGK